MRGIVCGIIVALGSAWGYSFESLLALMLENSPELKIKDIDISIANAYVRSRHFIPKSISRQIASSLGDLAMII